MNLELYLLSIIDNLHVICIPAMVVGSLLAFITVITTCCSFDTSTEAESVWLRKFSYKMFKFLILAFSIAFLFSLVPTRDDIVKAYMMQEGAKLVTAKNADKAVEEFTKRLDKVIEHFTEKK